MPGAGADELLKAGDVAVADQQGDRLDALAFGADQEPLEIVERVVLGLLLAEERGESLVEVDQLLGRGAHVVRCHGGLLLTGCSWGDGPAGPSLASSQATRRRGGGKHFLRL